MIEINFTLAIQAVNFLLMLWFLNAFVFKPILRVVAEREKKFKTMEQEGKGLAERCDNALTQYESKLAQIKKDAAEITGGARRGAQEASAKIMEDARGRFKQAVEKARLDIQKDADTASEQLKKDVNALAQGMAAKIIGRSVN
ncbi:MAG: F0F1 ATP synthase subunit B [Nitrospinae bacterium]|nr:F0F1 ATP synthase subunit B [Nitrospinota bacterium]